MTKATGYCDLTAEQAANGLAKLASVARLRTNLSARAGVVKRGGWDDLRSGFESFRSRNPEMASAALGGLGGAALGGTVGLLSGATTATGKKRPLSNLMTGALLGGGLGGAGGYAYQRIAHPEPDPIHPSSDLIEKLKTIDDPRAKAILAKMPPGATRKPPMTGGFIDSTKNWIADQSDDLIREKGYLTTPTAMEMAGVGAVDAAGQLHNTRFGPYRGVSSGILQEALKDPKLEAAGIKDLSQARHFYNSGVDRPGAAGIPGREAITHDQLEGLISEQRRAYIKALSGRRGPLAPIPASPHADEYLQAALNAKAKELGPISTADLQRALLGKTGLPAVKEVKALPGLAHSEMPNILRDARDKMLARSGGFAGMNYRPSGISGNTGWKGVLEGLGSMPAGVASKLQGKFRLLPYAGPPVLSLIDYMRGHHTQTDLKAIEEGEKLVGK